MDKQEAFNKAWQGLKAQGWQRARNEADNGCAYRSPDGKKCGIGHCIPDELYDPTMEGGAIDNMLDFGHFPKLLTIFRKEDAAFLWDLQRAHDRALCPEDMEQCMRSLAASYDLTVPAD